MEENVFFIERTRTGKKIQRERVFLCALPVAEHELVFTLCCRAVTLQVVQSPLLPVPRRLSLASDWSLALLPVL